MAELLPSAAPVAGAPRSPAGSVLRFFALTFAATWTCYITAVALSRDNPPGAPMGLELQALVLLGTFSPSLVALALTARAESVAGVRALLGRLFRWEVGARWYVFAASYMVVIKLIVAVAHRLITGAWPRFSSEPWFLMVAATIFSTVVGGQAGEEIGWRGYALPRLSARFGLGGASLLLGVIWACWHLPLFYLPGADSYYGQSFPVYLLAVTAVSVPFAWLYWRTGGSLLLTMLMHAAINNTNVVPAMAERAGNVFRVSASLVGWLTVSAVWVAAGYFLARMRKVGRGVELESAGGEVEGHD